MERAGLDDLVILGFRFFPTLLGVRVASFPAAALRAVGHGFVPVSLAPRWVLLFLAQRCVFSRVSLLETRPRLARGGDEHFLVI